MKIALLLPGYLESPDYRHLVVIDEKLSSLGYAVKRVDPCHLWATGEVEKYILTNYIKQIMEIIDSYESEAIEEVVLIGHSLGASAAILVGADDVRVTKIICLSPAVVLDKSREKWNEDGIRCSKKDLPDNPASYREFCIPISHLDDRKKYSVPSALSQLKIPVMFLYGAEDSTSKDIEKVISEADISKVVKVENMNHDFRYSSEYCNLVSGEVEKFLA